MKKDVVLTQESLSIEIKGVCLILSLILITALVVCIIPILLNQSYAVFFTSQPLYLMTLILFIAVLYSGVYGILIGIVTFILCGMIIDLPPYLTIINGLMNLFQLIIIHCAYIYLRKKFCHTNINKYSTGVLYLSGYNFFLLFILVIYLGYCILYQLNSIIIFSIISVIIFIMTIAKSILNKDRCLIYYTFIIALIPSFIASSISVILSGVPNELVIEYITIWTFSNYILLQTAGYLAFQFFYTRRLKTIDRGKIYKIDVCTIVYYIAALVWSIFMLYIVYLKLIQTNTYIYFFPWFLGNIFLLTNLYFSYTKSIDKRQDKFNWVENRVITIEKNTTGIISIIAFLLPLSVSLMHNVPSVLIKIFITNIFCTCISICLIWVPKNNLKFISILQSIKTVFYLFSIDLLLLSIIMIMFSLAQ